VTHLGEPQLATPREDVQKTGNPLSIAIVGQSGWGGRIAGMLSKHAADLVMPTVFADSSVLRLLVGHNRADVLLRIGYRPGAPTARGRAFDALWSMIRLRHPGAAVVYYWLGTDVLNAAVDGSERRLRSAFRASASDLHLVAAPWHIDELSALGISSTFAAVPYAVASDPVLPMPARFAALTYLPRGRFDFYGGPQVFELARRFPQVAFRVLGGGSRPPEAPGNVEYLGWVSETGPCYQASAVVLRVVPHDGIGGTVLEGLAHARHVIYTYPFPHVRQAAFDDVDQMARLLSELTTEHGEGRLEPNLDGREYVLQEHDEHRLSRALASELVAAGRVSDSERR
jgi:hypothetical protein